MGRPRIAIDESKVFEACKEGSTITGILVALQDAVTRETLVNRIKEYLAAGKLIWDQPGSRGKAGILKTP
jgi:hypothetical protein